MRNFSLPRLALLLIGLFLSGCAHFTINNAIEAPNPTLVAYSSERADDLLIVLSFSGGGARASALAYGALEALSELSVNWQGKQRRLLDEIDMISAVSGGSFTAAYFGLHGDGIFKDFKPRFLYRDIDGDLVKQFFNPLNWARMWSPNFNRSELSIQHYDNVLFDRATFADLRNSGGPDILINATDITLGDSFTFDQLHFDLLCSELNSFPISRAAAASSAVPGILSTVTLFNYAGACDYQAPDWVNTVLKTPASGDERASIARKIHTYQNILERPYIHLLDGGLADNLGLRSVMDRVRFHQQNPNSRTSQLLNKLVKKVLVIVVNASAEPNIQLNLSKNPPSTFDSVDIATTVQVNRYNADTLKVFKSAVEKWRETARMIRCGDQHCDAEPQFYFINAGLMHITDSDERNFLRQQPTSFSLSRDAIDRLISAGKSLVLDAAGTQQFLESF